VGAGPGVEAVEAFAVRGPAPVMRGAVPRGYSHLRVALPVADRVVGDAVHTVGPQPRGTLRRRRGRTRARAGRGEDPHRERQPVRACAPREPSDAGDGSDRHASP